MLSEAQSKRNPSVGADLQWIQAISSHPPGAAGTVTFPDPQWNQEKGLHFDYAFSIRKRLQHVENGRMSCLENENLGQLSSEWKLIRDPVLKNQRTPRNWLWNKKINPKHSYHISLKYKEQQYRGCSNDISKVIHCMHLKVYTADFWHNTMMFAGKIKLFSESF